MRCAGVAPGGKTRREGRALQNKNGARRNCHIPAARHFHVFCELLAAESHAQPLVPKASGDRLGAESRALRGNGPAWSRSAHAPGKPVGPAWRRESTEPFGGKSGTLPGCGRLLVCRRWRKNRRISLLLAR